MRPIVQDTVLQAKNAFLTLKVSINDNNILSLFAN